MGIICRVDYHALLANLQAAKVGPAPPVPLFDGINWWLLIPGWLLIAAGFGLIFTPSRMWGMLHR